MVGHKRLATSFPHPAFLGHIRRFSATSGRPCSAARRSFFVTEPEPVQKAAHGRTVDRDPMPVAQFDRQSLERQVALLVNPGPNPLAHIRQLATARIALTPRIKTASLAPKLDHIVHKARRNPKVPGRFAVPMALINKRNNAFS
jgi:hypothetical protein